MFVQSLFIGGVMEKIWEISPSTRRSSRAVAAEQHLEVLGRGMVLLGAFVSFVLSVSLWFTADHQQAIFVGIWVPSILALGGFMARTR
jgi:hypothetical protein